MEQIKKISINDTEYQIIDETALHEGDMPTALPNPNKLILTGAVTGEYDGSEALTLSIPSAPTALSAFTDDATHRLVTDAEKSTWNAKANTSDIPTKTSELTNDSGYITSAPVTSVNNKTGAVTLSASDVGADASGTANSAVASHNTDTSAHADIREQISQLSSEKVVLYSEQILADEEKAQARANIGATTALGAANSIEECTDTSKQYVLPDGYIYEYRLATYEKFTDVLKDVGYRSNSYYSNSQGAVLDLSAGWGDTTGYIPCKTGDLIRVENMTIPDTYTASRYWNRVSAFRADKTFIKTQSLFTQGAATGAAGLALNAVSENGNVTQFTIMESVFGSDVDSIIIGALITDDSKVFVNSEIVTEYTWVNTGVYHGSAEALESLKTDVEELKSTVADHETRISDIEENGVGVSTEEVIPDYVIEEAEATIAKLFTHGNLGRTIRFIAISDTHETSEGTPNAQITTSNLHAGQAIKYISDRIGLDFIAHLGDASGSGSWAVYSSINSLITDIKNINDFIFSGVRGVKTVFIPGNHDQCSDSNLVRLNNSGAFPLFGGMCDGKKDRIKGCGYFDIDDANVRVIYLNLADVPDGKVDTVATTYLGITQEQKNWLCETLIDTNTKDNADEWGILILSHSPLDYGADPSAEILLPYVNGGSYNGYDFSGKNGAKIISNVHGHTHSYAYGYLGDKIRRFCIPNACFLGNNHYSTKTDSNGVTYIERGWAEATTYNKTANTGKDTTFSLVTIDLDNNKCYVDNYGAGIDRVFSTDYKSETQVVPVSLSDIAYSGGATAGETIETSRLSFTVTYSDGTTNSVTGATSVSPTVFSAGSNTVTVTYIENGVTITGTQNITASNAPEEPKSLVSITNITYSGDTTVGTTLDKSKFSFTANYSDDTTADKTGATSISPTTVTAVGNNTITVTYTEGGVSADGTATIVGTEAPVARLLNLDRTYITGTNGTNIGQLFDTTKAYTNVPYGTGNCSDEAKPCVATNVTEDSATIKEPSVGGICIAYPVDMTDSGATSFNIKFDYSGTGKCRVYCGLISPSSGNQYAKYIILSDSTAGASGSIDETYSLEGCSKIVLYFSSNTGQTKTYTNVSLTGV